MLTAQSGVPVRFCAATRLAAAATRVMDFIILTNIVDGFGVWEME